MLRAHPYKKLDTQAAEVDLGDVWDFVREQGVAGMAVVGSKFGVRRFHLEAAGFQFTEADENGQVNVVVADDMERPTACVQVEHQCRSEGSRAQR